MSEWEAYDRLEPIGEERIELYFASLCSLISNVSIRALGKKGTKLTSPLDFVFKWDAETEETQVVPDSGPSVEVRGQTQEEQKKVLLQIAKLFGANTLFLYLCKRKEKVIPTVRSMKIFF